MVARKPARALMLLLVSITVIAGLLGLAPVAEQAQQPSQRAVSQLQSRTGEALAASYDARYGNITFLMGRLPYQASVAARGNALATAIEFLAQNPGLYGMSNPAAELSLMRTTSDGLGQLHVRLQQQVNGVPVYGHSLYVHLDASGNVIGTNGHFIPGVSVSTTPALEAATAEALALRASGAAGAVVRGPSTLVVYVDETGTAHLTWRVEVWDAHTPARDYYFIAARGGAVVHVIDMLMTAKDRTIYDAQNTEDIPGTQVGREGEVPREAAAKAAYQYSGQVYDYYTKVHSRDSFDDRGSTIVSTVHFGQDYSNAFWDGEQMIYGDGGPEVTKPYVFALDVDAHELTHAVTQYTANLNYEGQSGALNESYSDVFGVMIDRANWQMGEAIWNGDNWPTPYLRDFVDPSLGGYYDPNDPLSSPGQPTTMDEFANLPPGRKTDNGGVHVNSGITNHATYLAAQGMGNEEKGKQMVEKVWYRTLTTYLTEGSEFADFVTATLKSAEDLYGKDGPEYKAISSAFDEVKLTGTGASDPTPVASATPRKGTAVPQPTPNKTAGCTELITNGGFEKGNAEPWIEHTTLDVSIVSEELPHTGKRSAWLGGSDQESFQYLYQDIQIAANAKSVTLTYWHYLHEELNDNKAEPAEFSALAATTDGDILEKLEIFSSAKADEQWTQSTVNLKKYAGKTLRLAFSAAMSSGNISSFFIDDVSVTSCTSGTGPATATPSGGGAQGYTVSGHITDYNTGDGIAGASVFVLKEGLSATDAAADGRVTRDEVFSKGVTDRDGLYTLDQLLKAKTTYSAIVIADGYYSIIADDVIDTSQWGNQTEITDLDGQMQPSQ